MPTWAQARMMIVLARRDLGLVGTPTCPIWRFGAPRLAGSWSEAERLRIGGLPRRCEEDLSSSTEHCRSVSCHEQDKFSRQLTVIPEHPFGMFCAARYTTPARMRSKEHATAS